MLGLLFFPLLPTEPDGLEAFDETQMHIADDVEGQYLTTSTPPI